MREYNVYDIKEFAGKEVVGFEFSGNSVAPWCEEYQSIVGKTGKVVYCNDFSRVISIDFGDIEIKVSSYEFCRHILSYGDMIEPYPYHVGDTVDVIKKYRRESDGVEYEGLELGWIKSIIGSSFNDMRIRVKLHEDSKTYTFPYEKVRPYAPKIIYY